MVPILEYLGAGEKVIAAFKMPGVGNAAVAYLCYKVKEKTSLCHRALTDRACKLS